MTRNLPEVMGRGNALFRSRNKLQFLLDGTNMDAIIRPISWNSCRQGTIQAQPSINWKSVNQERRGDHVRPENSAPSYHCHRRAGHGGLWVSGCDQGLGRRGKSFWVRGDQEDGHGVNSRSAYECPVPEKNPGDPESELVQRDRPGQPEGDCEVPDQAESQPQ